MRIFQILEKTKFDTGSVHQMFQAATGLAGRGHEVTIVSRADETLERKAGEHGVRFASLPFRHELDRHTIRGLQRLVEQHDPEVIHVHKGLSHTLALIATWRRPVPAFVVNRGVSFELTPWNRGKYRLERVSRVVTVCAEIKQIIVRSGKLPPEKVTVVYAGTDVDTFLPGRFDSAEFRNEKGIGPDEFLVMQVGVRDWKGWRELIDAFADVARTGRRMKLALIAFKKIEQQREILAYAEGAGASGLVLPVEVRHDMPRVLSAADLVVDASWSGTGITGTIREAMALEKPVIATDCGGNPELVSGPEVGWLVPPRNRTALAKALKEVLADPDRAAATGKAARKRVVEGFSKEIRISRLEALYSSILAEKGALR